MAFILQLIFAVNAMFLGLRLLEGPTVFDKIIGTATLAIVCMWVYTVLRNPVYVSNAKTFALKLTHYVRGD